VVVVVVVEEVVISTSTTTTANNNNNNNNNEFDALLFLSNVERIEYTKQFHLGLKIGLPL
jgi:hypothetical protein